MNELNNILNMDISVIIVNYNTTIFVKSCLDSMIFQTNGIEYEIIVVDNDSSDRDIEELPNIYENVKFVFLDRNNGFGAGCNFGAKIANGKYLAFINPDIVIKDNVLLGFFKYLETNKDVGLCSGILIDEDGNPQYCFNDFPGIKWEFYEAFGLFQSKVIKKILSHPYIVNNVVNEFEVDWFHGACIFMKRELFLKVNGFDEKIFLYYEDVDLCQKVKKMGYKIVCLPYIRLVHYMRSSVRSVEGERIYYYYMHTSKIYYMKKYFGFTRCLFVRLMFISGTFLKIIILPFRKKFKSNILLRYNQYIVTLKVYLKMNIKLNL